MLRFFFWTLLIINALLFSTKLAFDHGHLDSFVTKNNESYRMKAQLNPEKIKLMSLDETINVVEKSTKKNTPTPPLVAAPVTSASPEITPTAPEITPTASVTAKLISCLEVGKFTQAETAGVDAILKKLQLGSRQSLIDVSDSPKTMVYLPGLGSKDAVDKKSAQLRKLGINDFHLVDDKNLPVWSISLGVFSTPEAAKTHQANLEKKGIKETRIAMKTSATSKFAYRFKNIELAEKNVIDTLKSKIANYHVNNCAAK